MKAVLNLFVVLLMLAAPSAFSSEELGEARDALLFELEADVEEAQIAVGGDYEDWYSDLDKLHRDIIASFFIVLKRKILAHRDRPIILDKRVMSNLEFLRAIGEGGTMNELIESYGTAEMKERKITPYLADAFLKEMRSWTDDLNIRLVTNVEEEKPKCKKRCGKKDSRKRPRLIHFENPLLPENLDRPILDLIF